MAVLERDVIIVGAGPAGAICAAYLAKAGVDVLLLEKDMCFGEKACGDMICEGMVGHIDVLGKVEALDDISTCIRNIKLISDGGRETLIPFECYCAPRRDMVRLLVDSAVSHGAEFRRGCRVLDVIKEQGVVTGVKARYRGEEVVLRSKIVIGADGSHSTIAGSVGITAERSYGIWLGERAYFKGIKLDKRLAREQYDAYGVVAFSKLLGAGYFWIMPVGKDGVEKGICNIGMMIQDRDSYKTLDLQERFTKWINGSPSIKAMFEDAERISPWKGGRINDMSQFTDKAVNGCMLIGDAASLIMPLAIDGMSIAANSAKAAATAASLALKEGNFSGEKLDFEYKHALRMKSEDLQAKDLKEKRLLMESIHDPAVMDNIVELLDKDPVFRKKTLK